ncbi:bifunctional 5,10-methylenetetrahydrofolate dehydrogenase/5,10-methenyltetrahydrofolate cyclohydrolase [Adlercreutzia sp. ZJ141]|uniref:bifunctional 5,10-methylenetetrahydrofolate dehydrogenase/5,10-methenyltetrahydrofolate cyclohydrolase n=1 Tax=Adlercreutzia sp. ZJ141 TaxID=2709406 RepID=UPI0013EA400E|nr:tetrahydrofolate dehydrogenase/cyclohydrolase catalytic domain-containing protein [Adlercreutzia sp. ZJ141]
MAVLLKGKPVVKAMGETLRCRIAELQDAGVQPTLAIVRVGDRPDDLSYERTAMKRAASLGVAVKPYVLDAQVPQDMLMSTLHSINYDKTVHGCLMFRPLPAHIDEATMCDMLAPEKDIDGISSASLSAVFTDSKVGFPPATAQACISILDHYGIPIEGKHVVVIGRSLVIGKPVAMMLLARNASVTVCHSRTENLPDITHRADIVICAAGRARAFGSEYFRAGQAVLDVGINFDDAGELCGDVDFEAVEPVVGFITPVPGGVGTVTTSVTMAHVVQAAEALR